jgi:hypothetical protein
MFSNWDITHESLTLSLKHGWYAFLTRLVKSFLAFETEKKAELFLKEKIDLVTDLSKAGII